MVEPATRFSGGAPGNSSAVGVRSATVTYPVASTKRANCSLVTSVASIQNPSTETRWTGSASAIELAPPHSVSPDSVAIVTASTLPIENSPPGIQTIPAGAGAGAGAAFGMVGANAAAS